MAEHRHLSACLAGLAVCLLFAAALSFGLYRAIQRWLPEQQSAPATPPCTLKPGEVAHITAWVEGNNQVVARCEIYRGKS